MDRMVRLYYLKDLPAVPIPRSTQVVVVIGEVAKLQTDVLPDNTMNVQTTYGELLDDVNNLKRQLAENGAMARRFMRMRYKVLGKRIKEADLWVCIGMLKGVPDDAQKWDDVNDICFEYATLEHVLYKTPIALVLEDSLPAEVKERMQVWKDKIIAMRAINDAGREES